MRSPWLIISLAIIALLALLAACGGGGDTTSATPSSAASSSPTPAPTAEGVGDLAHSVVEIIAADSGGNPVWWGSGTLISADGLILTNGHVVDNRNNDYSQLQIALTVVQDEPPDVKYTAEIQTVDYAIDLAVIKITKTIGGNAVPSIARRSSGT